MTDRLCPMGHGDDEQGNPLQREAAPGLVLCRPHRGWLERDILRLPDYWDDLALRLHPSGPTLKPYTTHDAGGTATVNPKTGEEESQTYINDHIATLRTLIVSTLASWVVLVAEERGLQAPATADPHVLASWLARHADWIAAQPVADEPAGHFSELSSTAYRTAYPSGRRRVQIGKCPECDNGGLYAVVSRTAELLPAEIRCDSCPNLIGSRQWRALRKTLTGLDVETVLTVTEACQMYDISVPTLYRWISDRRVNDIGEGQIRVRASELEDTLHRMGVLRDVG